MKTEDEHHARQYPVSEDMRMQRRVWRFERIGWYGLLVVVGLTLAGLFGSGPLSERTATSPDGRVQVDYARFTRSGAAEQLRIRIQGKPDDQATLLLDGSMFRDLTVETLQPQPLVSLSQGQALLLHLGTDTDGVAMLYMTLRNDSVGQFSGQARVGPNSVVRFSTFVYP
ncbi:hypothetical protein PS910_02230 [Pseudomonas fluorescens]|nr:hypothetical protein PS910_02230 [Pseudomonas fluorescens]